PEPVATAAPPVVAPNLGAQQTELTGNADATLIYPVQGTIIRAYAAGRNDGIDIASDAQTPVKAAAAGVVAAITTNTDGIQIVVIRHSDNLLTVYTHLEALTVTRDDTVSQGQVIGQVLAGNPSYLHFEVRRGMDSADPADFLP
ncbi:MAG: M23 family metallopeptidase, partial [Rhodobacteraceae bacterium]|nr:M23 family metallopeptidase [Paracoccaceae bacterium]